MNKEQNNPFTGGTNYLGLNPFTQTKEFTLGGPQFYKTGEYVFNDDYKLPNNTINNNPALGPRVSVHNYEIPHLQVSAGEARSIQNKLNGRADEQNQFQGGQFLDTYNLVNY